MWVDFYKDPFRTILAVELPLLPSCLIFRQTICVSISSYFSRNWNTSVLPWLCEKAMGDNIGWVNLALRLILWFCPKLSCECLTNNTKKGASKSITAVPCQQECIYCYCSYVGYHKPTYLKVHWKTIRSMSGFLKLISCLVRDPWSKGWWYP